MRTVHSHPDLMHTDGGEKDARAIMKIAIAFLVTLGLVFLVHGFLTREFSRQDRPSDFEEEFTF